jgi:hypothetical protein
MRLFHRTTLAPDVVLSSADEFFITLGLARGGVEARSRSYKGALGALMLSVRMEGGHYTLIEASTDQIGESRLDKNVKIFFVAIHRQAEPSHRVEAGY